VQTKWKAEFCYYNEVAGYTPRWFIHLQTHPSTNQTQHTATTLIESNILTTNQINTLS